MHIVALYELDWKLEIWPGNIWEDSEDPKNSEPLTLIEYLLTVQEISPSLSDESILPLVKDTLLPEGVTLKDEASSLHDTFSPTNSQDCQIST